MVIRPFVDGDERHILDLFALAFGKSMSEQAWQWRYKQNPFTSQMMIHLMWDGDTLAGHYAVSPVEMRIEEQLTLTALSMTTMTHPDYAGKGIFSKLAESVYQEIYSSYGVQAVWGFPNANSHYGFIKNLAWSDCGTIPFLSLRVVDRSPRVEPYRVVTSLTQSHADQLERNLPRTISVNKNLMFLEWRYCCNPIYKYEIIELEAGNAFVIFKIIPSFSDSLKFEVDIMEWSFDGPQQADLLVDAILDYSKMSGKSVIKVNTWESLFSERHIWLEKIRFALASPVTFFGVRQLGKSSHNFADLRKWNVSMGNSDVF